MTQPPPERVAREPGGDVPRLLLVLYVLLPAWAFVYLFVAGGLAPPEVKPMARQVPGVQGVVAAGGAAEEKKWAEQVRGILAVVPRNVLNLRPPSVSEAALRDAKRQYDTLCAVCHGPEGKGDGPAGAALNPPPLNFHARAFQQEMPPGVTYWVIKNGLGNTARRSGMPGFGTLSDQQIWALVVYIRQLGGR